LGVIFSKRSERLTKKFKMKLAEATLSGIPVSLQKAAGYSGESE
jgi:hypothetical protein